MFIMLILLLSAYQIFWAYSRGDIYRDLNNKMWEDVYQRLSLGLVRERLPGVSRHTEAALYDCDTNKLYEDFLWNCLPVVGELRWWRARPR